MKICDNRQHPTVPFSSILQGEMFTDVDHDYMMKIEPVNYLGSDYNAVDLHTGYVYTFTDDYQCIKINSAVINITD